MINGHLEKTDFISLEHNLFADEDKEYLSELFRHIDNCSKCKFECNKADIPVIPLDDDVDYDDEEEENEEEETNDEDDLDTFNMKANVVFETYDKDNNNKIEEISKIVKFPYLDTLSFSSNFRMLHFEILKEIYNFILLKKQK